MALVQARLDIEAAVELVAVDTADTAAELKPLFSIRGNVVAIFGFSVSFELPTLISNGCLFAEDAFDAMTVLKQSVASFELSVDTLSVPSRSGSAVEGVRTLLMIIGLP